ncbi:outer membrane lipoprotein chaperone LolA [Thiotrichales bacterium 19S11-10]|nr:outer membrane lipoprotein chaperone LolA [Thiotrichales bacterium 19S11-10]
MSKLLFKKCFFYLSLTVLLFSYTRAFAMQTPTETDELLQRLHYIDSYKANFTQTVVDKATNNQNVSYGTLWVKQPSFFKWEIIKPNKQLLISNGKTLWNYDTDLQQVIIEKVPEHISEAPILLLLKGDPKSLNQLFIIKRLKKNKFLLTPRNTDTVAIKEILIFFDNGHLKKLTLRSFTDMDTYILFSDFQKEEFPNNFFSFSPPKGVDILSSQ